MYTLSQPHRSHDRHVRRRAFRSVFVHSPRPAPFRYWLDSRECARTIGVSERTVAMWLKEWKEHGYGPGVKPILVDRIHYRYLWEAVTQNSDGTFLALMKQSRVKFLAGNNGFKFRS